MKFQVQGVFGGGAPAYFEVHAESVGEARLRAEAAGVTVLAVHSAEAPPPGVRTSAGPAPAPARLVDCPACGGRVSTEAVSCPHCGHPMRAAVVGPAGPVCYACTTPATTRCQSCGALSCALHLQSIYVSHGRGGAYELRCTRCHSSARMWQSLGLIWAAVVILGVLGFLSSMGIGPFRR
jgi:hypothetical protein